MTAPWSCRDCRREWPSPGKTSFQLRWTRLHFTMTFRHNLIFHVLPTIASMDLSTTDPFST